MEKPLHVQIAEILEPRVKLREIERQDIGYVRDGAEFPGIKAQKIWQRFQPYEDEPSDGLWLDIPHYNYNWGATGPLIERYEINIDKREAGWFATCFGKNIYILAHLADPQMGRTPLEAVCKLIVEMDKQGTLPKAE
jgi:hypothetical protein